MILVRLTIRVTKEALLVLVQAVLDLVDRQVEILLRRLVLTLEVQEDFQLKIYFHRYLVAWVGKDLLIAALHSMKLTQKVQINLLLLRSAS